MLFLSISHQLANVILERFIKKAENKNMNQTMRNFFMVIYNRIKDN
jgi:hypothetical protein